MIAGAAAVDPVAVPGPVRGHGGRVAHRGAAAAEAAAAAFLQRRQRAPGRGTGPVAAGAESLRGNRQSGEISFCTCRLAAQQIFSGHFSGQCWGRFFSI